MKYILKTFFLHIRYSIITLLLSPLFILYSFVYYLLFKKRKKQLELFLKNTKIQNFSYYDHQFCYFNNFINPDQERLNSVLNSLKISEKDMNYISNQLYTLSEFNRKMSARLFKKQEHYSGHSIKYNKKHISLDWLMVYCDLFVNFPLIIQTQYLDKYTTALINSYKGHFINNIISIIINSSMPIDSKKQLAEDVFKNKDCIKTINTILSQNEKILINSDMNKLRLNLLCLSLNR